MTTPVPPSPNDRINNLFERLALALMGLLLSVLFMTYQGARSDIKELQGQITALQMTKVSKEDLREVENRLNNKVDAAVNSLAAMSATNKADILQRIDYAFGLKGNRH